MKESPKFSVIPEFLMDILSEIYCSGTQRALVLVSLFPSTVLILRHHLQRVIKSALEDGFGEDN